MTTTRPHIQDIARPTTVLSIAGSDSGAGAGIQADLKTVMDLGGYATCAVTAVTAQNTRGVNDIWPVPAAALSAQINAITDDFVIDAAKTGMFATADQVDAVRLLWAAGPDCPRVIDPVLRSSSGTALGDNTVATALLQLIPLATLVTPNAAEAQALTGRSDPRAAAEALITHHGARAVLLTGGDLPRAGVCTDVLVTDDGVQDFAHPLVETRGTHGTGCTLSSALALFLGRGDVLPLACEQAIAYTLGALGAAPGLGYGRGPLGHGRRRGGEVGGGAAKGED